MRKVKLLLLLFVISLVLPIASAESIKGKIISYIHPKYIIEQIKSQPYLLYFAIGKFYFRIGNLDKSLDMFEKAVKFNPDFAPSYHNIGVIYYKKGDYINAFVSFRKARELDSSYAKAHYSEGILSFELGDFDNAIAAFSNVVELQPDNANANFDLAQAYVARFRREEEINGGDYTDLESALFYLRQAEELQPGFPHASDNIKVIESITETRRVLLNQS